MYISVKVHLIVYFLGVHFIVCNSIKFILINKVDLKKKTCPLESDPNLKSASVTNEVANICALGSSLIKWG